MTDSLPQMATVVAADVDWLSYSVRASSASDLLLRWRDERFRVLADEGFDEKRYSAHGYSYRARGSVAVGIGEREIVCQLSGISARDGWREGARWATQCSRIDLAVTARTDTRTDSLAREGYRAADARPRGRGRASALTLIQAQDRGDTLYVGSRASDQLGRLYDKWRESGDEHYRDCWRWEVQYRRAQAMSHLRALALSDTPAASITATVASWFTNRGVRSAYRVDADSLAPGSSRPLPDDARWLAWVRACVQPRARRMVARYGWRYIAEACAGRIESYEAWESIFKGIEIEFLEEETGANGQPVLDHCTYLA